LASIFISVYFPGYFAKVEAKGMTFSDWILSRDLFDHSSVNRGQLPERLALRRGVMSEPI
jgi:hypothetical protein